MVDVMNVAPQSAGLVPGDTYSYGREACVRVGERVDCGCNGTVWMESQL